jgi:hypothetical protein
MMPPTETRRIPQMSYVQNFTKVEPWSQRQEFFNTPAHYWFEITGKYRCYQYRFLARSPGLRNFFLTKTSQKYLLSLIMVIWLIRTFDAPFGTRCWYNTSICVPYLIPWHVRSCRAYQGYVSNRLTSMTSRSW